MVLNTNLMKRQDENDEDARKQWDWLETVLEKFSRNKETVSSFSNCSFISQVIQNDCWCTFSNQTYHINHAKFMQIILEFPSNCYSFIVIDK